MLVHIFEELWVGHDAGVKGCLAWRRRIWAALVSVASRAMRDDHVVVLGYTGPDHSKIPFSADSDSKPSSQLPYLCLSICNILSSFYGILLIYLP